MPESQSVTDASIASSSILAIRTVTTPAAQCHARKAAFAIPSNQATASSYIPKERKAGRKDLGLKSDLKYHECFCECPTHLNFGGSRINYSRFMFSYWFTFI